MNIPLFADFFPSEAGNPFSPGLILLFSFVVALTGAMSPGPLLTYTIVRSIADRRYGYLMGFWIIGGHALLELAIIMALLLGFSVVLINPTVVRIIGAVGGSLLVYFGSNIVLDVVRGRISLDWDGPTTSSAASWKENPVLGGIAISMANPYWWVWWATIGLAFMLQFDISLANRSRLVAFFVGHEMGDLLWYLLVSCVAFLGRRYLSKKAYSILLACCGLFMIAFGLYLGFSPFVNGGHRT